MYECPIWVANAWWNRLISATLWIIWFILLIWGSNSMRKNQVQVFEQLHVYSPCGHILYCTVDSRINMPSMIRNSNISCLYPPWFIVWDGFIYHYIYYYNDILVFEHLCKVGNWCWSNRLAIYCSQRSTSLVERSFCVVY